MTAPGSLINIGQIEDLCDLAAGTPPGCFVEVGVYKGGSAYFLMAVAVQQGRKLHLYDTFAGMPFADPEIDKEHNIGDFADTSVEEVRAAVPDAIYHVGVFPDTFSPIGPIAFVHVDCDQYQSVYDCIDVLWRDMVPGAIMVFDDYEHTSGARKAIDDALLPSELQTMPGGQKWVRKP